GKSTLARLVAGRRAPTSGRVDRPGAVGLGRPGGTAMVFQRPEAQVLGVRVRDDVVWGLSPADRDAIDVDAVLDRVGLRAFADRETSTLSGGELQRLAIAAATARGPGLFVSDEATAMVDAGGRARLVALLRSLADAGIGVVHVTHHANEAQLADRVVTLAAGRVVDTPLSVHPNGAVPAAPRPGNAVIALRDVGHVYSRRTPWAHRALIDVTLTIREHEAVLVVGHNGSGKSTLAWVLSGLLDPSEGRAELDGRPITEQVGRVGLSFQHARLQLLRPTVLDEVRAAASVDDEAAAAALAAVGLDAAILGSARVDELSGGQMRRVVLAGVLAAEPRVIVLDEPFAGLDAHGRAELRAVLARLRAERGVALVVVSHDPDLSPHDFDRVVELVAGRIVRDEPAGDVVTELQP
ncbi:MAG TPA: ABC transporter ATP-binding protein, partial [Acidimicrobiia bacterium]|nr:ABC transporter ATP-binding protein [Acidimicrobiia bacterium]